MDAAMILKSPFLIEGILESSAIGQIATVEQVVIAGYGMGN
jgi:hypothetical protein